MKFERAGKARDLFIGPERSILNIPRKDEEAATKCWNKRKMGENEFNGGEFENRLNYTLDSQTLRVGARLAQPMSMLSVIYV